jgi:hypothetical protein
MTDLDLTEDIPLPYADPPVPIPDGLKPFVAEWLGEQMKLACQDVGPGDWTEEQQEKATKFFRLWDAMHGRLPLSPQDVVVVAEQAAKWQEGIWPKTVEEVAAYRVRLDAAGGLLQLRDRARAFVEEQRRSRKPRRPRPKKD